MDIETDIVIIGGGINGCAIAAEATLRGYSVSLIEKSDFAAGASWASTKLIHGGVRYLAQGQIGMVRKAIKERTRLSQNAPLQVKPIALDLVEPNPFKQMLNRCGLWIYDHLDSKNPFKKSTTIDLQVHQADFIKTQYMKATRFYDAFTDDSRLTLLNAKQAHYRGAKLFNYCQLKSSDYTEAAGWQLQCERRSEVINIKAKHLINATGAWVNDVQDKLMLKSHFPVHLIKGSHLIFKNQLQDDAGLVLPTDDKRIIFILPYLGEFMLIGTTEVKLSVPSLQLKPSKDEISYLLKQANHYLVNTLSESDILWSYSGIRPLFGNLQHNDEGELEASKISRDFQIMQGEQNTLVIYGGKLTTHRQLAEQCIDKLDYLLSRSVRHLSQNLALPGNELGTLNENEHLKKLVTLYPELPKSCLQRLFYCFGTEIYDVLTNYYERNEEPICHDIFPFEISYLKDKEWLFTIEDYLWRRTKLGLWLTEEEKRQLSQFF